MRIAVLAHSARVAGGLSVGKNLVAAMGRVAPQHTFLFVIPAALGFEEICAGIPGCETFVVEHRGGLFGRWLFETFALGKIVSAFRPDVVFASANRGLRHPPCPQALLIQDPHLFYPRRHFGYRSLVAKVKHWVNIRHLRRVLRDTQLVLCQTPVAARRLVQRYKYEGQTGVCPNAVSQFIGDEDAHPSVPEILAPYADRLKLFCLTRYYAHKNLESIPILFERFEKELSGVTVVLTIDREQDAPTRRFLASIGRWELRGQVLNVGQIPQSTLADYYHSCDALFLPTLLESFTGTYAEAMHFGVPILTSDLDFAHHVCGRAAMYFDPWNAESIKGAILRLRADSDLRRDCVIQGRQRLQTMFKSWDEIAANVTGALESLCAASK